MNIFQTRGFSTVSLGRRKEYQRGLKYNSIVIAELAEDNMPEISRFFGIIVRMYAEPGAPHHQPHFHAYHQNHEAVFAIATLEILGGDLPQKERRLVEAWAELHRDELSENWQRLQSGQLPYKVAPLR